MQSVQKKLHGERRWSGQGISGFRQLEFEIIYTLSGEYSISKLCKAASVSRSGFYKWRARLTKPSQTAINFIANTELFYEYHKKYPSHGYRWLRAKILLDTGQIMSEPYAYKCCKALGIKSETKHYKYRKPGNPYRLYPNLLLKDLSPKKPLQCVVSDMTVLRIYGTKYELTFYLDLFNNEILSHSISEKRGDRTTYLDGLSELISIKDTYPDLEMILHTDQGSVYASKEFNDLLKGHNIIHSMSRAGTPTDNAHIEAINGWIKSELIKDLHIEKKVLKNK